MQIVQFEHKPLSHYSYAILSEGKIALVDPERDPSQYYSFADENKAQIVAVFETHPHADFVSSHRQIYEETGASIYTSKLLGAEYPHIPFDGGEQLKMGSIIFKALNTPGHSPDSITIVAKDDDQTALFTGDTLFIGDVGRPDLRENVGNQTAKRMELAKAMFKTIKNKFSDLPDDALVYPAHGAGSLCGKNLSSDNSSTLGNERMGNWAFNTDTEEEFVNTLLDSQPFIPHYFGFNVDLNKAGAANVALSTAEIPLKLEVNSTKDGILVIDTRQEAQFKKGHLPGSFNIMAVSENSKFETWLGSIVKPKEEFVLVADSFEHARQIVQRVAKIGYEKQVRAVVTLSETVKEQSHSLDLDKFKAAPENYTIVDIRNDSETKEGKLFENALTIPLHELRERQAEIPKSKPVVVHCAGGYRSAAGSSILENYLNEVTVLDLSESVKDFQ